MQIRNQKEYDDAVRNYRGSFPVYLTTTDGEHFGFEHGDGSDGWNAEGVVIDTVNNSEVWPSFGEASRCLALAKRGWRGEELRSQIEQVQATRGASSSACG